MPSHKTTTHASGKNSPRSLFTLDLPAIIIGILFIIVVARPLVFSGFWRSAIFEEESDALETPKVDRRTVDGDRLSQTAWCCPEGSDRCYETTVSECDGVIAPDANRCAAVCARIHR